MRSPELKTASNVTSPGIDALSSNFMPTRWLHLVSVPVHKHAIDIANKISFDDLEHCMLTGFLNHQRQYRHQIPQWLHCSPDNWFHSGFHCIWCDSVLVPNEAIELRGIRWDLVHSSDPPTAPEPPTAPWASRVLCCWSDVDCCLLRLGLDFLASPDGPPDFLFSLIEGCQRQKTRQDSFTYQFKYVTSNNLINLLFICNHFIFLATELLLEHLLIQPSLTIQ